MTIKEAAIQVLRERQKSLSSADIAQAIQDQKLFTFKVDQPHQVVRAALKKNSLNSSSPAAAKEPCFREIEGGLFQLI